MHAQPEWIKRGAGNAISVIIGGKVTPLRRTVWQDDCYQRHVAEQKAAAEARVAEAKKAAEDGAEVGISPYDAMTRTITNARVSSMAVALIAMNPIKDRIDWTEEQLQEHLDLDQIAILAETWLAFKVFNPKLSAETDPTLAPR